MADEVLTMNSVRIDVEDLKEKVKKNRQQHLEDYEKAVEAYKLIVVNELHKSIIAENEYFEKLKKDHKWKVESLHNKIKAFEEDWTTKPTNAINEPVNYLTEYDTAISMLDLSLDKVAVLNRTEFQSYVMDNWSWKT